ncbi:MAG TPA: LytTR family DNA-binding domain-containing protein [Flavisolibacter sp.]|jgi:DNA-binding LytR/AlgR family response regulator|nr:LytTR family DNA-binding domain-containing protein [Flavisolibacter sp.]
MNVLIIEDEKIAAQRLIDMLKVYVPDLKLQAVLDSVEASVRYFQDPYWKADLIFMDIELGDGQSFDILESVDITCPVIFVTAYQEHALRAFKLNSIDYLLKPLKNEDVRTALLKYEKYHVFNTEKAKIPVATAMHDQHVKLQKTRFLAKCGTRWISIPANQIAFFYTREKVQYIKTFSNEDFIIDKHLDEIEHELSVTDFFRANRQFVIRYESIERVHAWLNGRVKVQVKPASYEDIIVSRLRAADFKKWLGD